ncbi:zinc ribbon domain-containing protein [Lactobacillaceae bacterium Melli_B3]
MAASELIDCPRCHHLNDPANEFCDYCGFNIAHYFADPKEVDANPSVAELYAFKNYPSRLQTYGNKTKLSSKELDTQKVKLKFKSFKHPKRWSFAAAALIFVIGGYTYGQFYYSKTITLNRISDEAASGQMANRDLVDRSDRVVSSKVIAEQFKANPSVIDRLKAELNRSGRTQDGVFTYQKTGTHFGIFPKYQLVLNHQASKQVVAPKTYSVKIKTKPYALILLNGKVTSYADSHGDYQLNHLTNEQITLSAKYHGTKRGGIVTKPIKITPSDDQRVVTLIQRQVVTKAHGQQLLDRMYRSMQETTNHGKSDQALHHYFVDGKRNHYYQSVHQLALVFHQYQFKATYRPHITSFKHEGKNRYVIMYNLEYRFDSGQRVHIQLFRTYAVMTKDAEHHYRLVSVISDSTPIKDEYHHK